MTDLNSKVFSLILKTGRKSGCIHKSEVIVTPASIVTAIVEYAEKNYAELIVLGTGGLSGPKSMMLGSVASGVIICSFCPVLIIK